MTALWVRVYGLLLRLLPASVRERDREEILETFRMQLHHAGSGWARVRTALRGLRRLPGAVVREWMDETGWAAGSPRRPGTTTKGDGMSGWIRSVRASVRSLLKAPGFTWTTVLLVGLGIGSVTAVYTIVDDVLLRPLPYPEEARLVYMTNGSFNGPTLRSLDEVTEFESWTAVTTASVNLTRPDGDPLQLERAEVTADFFTLFGARPQLGRLLDERDVDHLDRVVLTDPAWRTVWGADPGIVGRTVRLDGEPVEVVGVLAADFVPPESLVGRELHLLRPMWWRNPELESPGYHAHGVAARLADGVTLATANSAVDRVAAEVAAAYPDYYDEGPESWPLVGLGDQTVQEVRTALLLLLGAVGLLMLVACANVAHLFMARGLSRGREMAIRRAMGARTRNLIGQLSIESLVVGFAGGALGLGLAHLALGGFDRWTRELPRGVRIDLDGGVFLVAVALATVTALLFGLVPALRTLGRDVQDGLRGGGRGISDSRAIRALRSGLVVAEVAVSLVLVTTAGLLIRSFAEITRQDAGVEEARVVMVPLTPTGTDDVETYRYRMEQVADALETVPGVASVAWGIEAPFEFTGGNRCCWAGRVTPPDEPDAQPIRVVNHPAGGDWFDTFGTEIIAGRTWTAVEAAAVPTPVVISAQLAERLYGSAAAAVGRDYDFQGGAIVVGVAEPTLHYGLDEPHDFALYPPIERLGFPIPRATFALRMRSDGAVEASGRAIRDAIWSVEPELPIPTVTTLERWIDESSGTRRLGSVLFGAFGALALLLAAAGLYGTLLYGVGQRRKELGIRMALGAGKGRIQQEVLRGGLTLAAIGVGVGVGIAFLTGRLLEQMVWGISPTDPATMATAALVLLAAAVLASWVPAWRAGRTDPLETLQAE